MGNVCSIKTCCINSPRVDVAKLVKTGESNESNQQNAEHGKELKLQCKKSSNSKVAGNISTVPIDNLNTGLTDTNKKSANQSQVQNTQNSQEPQSTEGNGNTKKENKENNPPIENKEPVLKLEEKKMNDSNHLSCENSFYNNVNRHNSGIQNKSQGKTSSGICIPQLQPPSQKFTRSNRRGMSLVQKTKLGSIIHKEELRLSVMSGLFVDELNESPGKKYKFLKKIGTGAYGTVYLAKNLHTDMKVAIKKIEKSSEDLLIDNRITDEIEILKKLDHPNIVKILEFYHTEKAYYVVNEFCEHGELYDQLSKKFNETQLSVIFRQILSGLCYLHDNHIIHRDLKLENVLLLDKEVSSKTGDILYSVKIIDFGTAKIFNKSQKQKQVVGSSYYIAPEVLGHNYNDKCDCWSLGVLLYMFLMGHAPFDGDTDEEIICNIKKGKYEKKNKKWIKASDEIRDLIEKLLEYNQDKRLSSYEALHHPWFTKFNSYLLYTNIKKSKIDEFVKNLLSYKISSKLQELVLAYIIHNIYKSSDIKDGIKLFQYFNKTGNGKLTKEELYEGIKEFATNDSLAGFEDAFIMLDGKDQKFLLYDAFLRGCLNKKDILKEETLDYAFKFFDKEKKGKLNVKNIKKYFVNDSHVDESVYKAIFDEIDTNQDGEIDYNEFKGIMLENVI